MVLALAGDSTMTRGLLTRLLAVPLASRLSSASRSAPRSGPRTPYAGRLGVIEEGAFADMLLVDGNPLENINLIADPAKNFKVIMKDGKIYKNTL